jgi:Xaa-Pro aminopeptidase
MFSSAVYQQRRQALLQALAAAGQTGTVLLMGQVDEAYNFAANPYPFRQDSSLLYYSGLNQPGVALLLDIDAGTTTLVLAPQSDDDRIWCELQPVEALQAASGVEAWLTPAAARQRIATPSSRGAALHVLPAIRPAQTLAAQALTGLADLPAPSAALIQAVVQQREVKDAGEIAQIERAVGVAHEMHEAARQACASGVTEAHLVREMHGVLARHGARMAYGPICTRDGHVLHHLSHDNTLRRGDLLLIDAGAEVPSGYASDITRTHCVDGAWTDTTRLLHHTVCAAQQAAAHSARAGVAMAEVHNVACRALVQGLAPLKLFKGSVDAVVESAACAALFPHGIGHLLGLDVHDMESLGEDAVGYDAQHRRDPRFGPRHLRLGKPLRAGMVITIEPGLYAMTHLWQRWRSQGTHADLIDHDALGALAGLGGVRHEDVFVVGPQGAERLGQTMPHAAAAVPRSGH